MASTSIGIIGPDVTPSVDVGRIDDASLYSAGEKYIAIRLGEDVTVIPPGFGAAQATYARTLAAALLAAAEAVEQPAAVPEVA